MKNFPIAIAVSILLFGCMHDAPNYPGASGSDLKPADFVNSVCPDFSGTYEGNGHLLRGDAVARQFGKTEFFDFVFPISTPDEWRKLRNSYRKAERNKTVPPDYAIVTNLGNSSVLITMYYNDETIGEYRSDFTDSQRFVCAGDKLVWGGRDNLKSRSEWGENSGNRTFSVFKDEGGNLIEERNQQVHMNGTFGIPMGTASYSAVYQFKKISK
jgi:hypothetical protein